MLKALNSCGFLFMDLLPVLGSYSCSFFLYTIYWFLSAVVRFWIQCQYWLITSCSLFL